MKEAWHWIDMHGSMLNMEHMKKIQVLFPDPSMERLRRVAEREDRSMSELIRRATECWLDRLPEGAVGTDKAYQPKTYRLGLKTEEPRKLKEAIYDREEG